MNPPSSPCCPNLNHCGICFYVLVTLEQKTMIFWYRNICVFWLHTQGLLMIIEQVIAFFSFPILLLWPMGRIFHLFCFRIAIHTDWLWRTVALVVAKFVVPQPLCNSSVDHKSGRVNYIEATIYSHLSSHETWGLLFSLVTFFSFRGI